jgi:hypothetical protein
MRHLDAETAARAVKELDGLEVMGRQLRADHAQKKEPGGYGGGGGRGGGGKTQSQPIIIHDLSQYTHHCQSKCILGGRGGGRGGGDRYGGNNNGASDGSFGSW